MRAGEPGPPDWSRGFHAAPAAAATSASARPTEAQIPAALLQELIDWARAGYPHEACGIVAGDAAASLGGRPTRFHGLRNAAASAYRYEIDPQEQLDTILAIDDAGEVVWGIVHSHVASPAEPSATDIGLAFYPDSLYLICSLAGDIPIVRAWSIIEGRPEEVSLRVA